MVSDVLRKRGWRDVPQIKSGNCSFSSIHCLISLCITCLGMERGVQYMIFIPNGNLSSLPCASSSFFLSATPLITSFICSAFVISRFPSLLGMDLSSSIGLSSAYMTFSLIKRSIASPMYHVYTFS